MADQEIPSLSAATAIDCDDLIHVVEDGNSRKVRAGTIGAAYGTAFPGAGLADGDRFYRTDLKMMCRYDLANTRWLSDELFVLPLGNAEAAAADGYVARRAVPYKGTYGIWLERWETVTYRSAAGSWNTKLEWVSAANVTTTISTLDSAADTSATWTHHEASLGSVLDANALTIHAYVDEVSGTATFYSTPVLYYRLIIT